MAAVRPPLPLRILLVASLSMCLLTAGYGLHYTLDWNEVRRGRSIDARRVSLLGVPWFKRPFIEFVKRLEKTIPPGSRVLLEPSTFEEPTSKSRWFLFLNYYAYPLEFYVRKPQWASGTLVDYPRWLFHHEHGLNKKPTERVREYLEIEDRGIDWKVRYPVRERFVVKDVEIFHLEGGEWIPVELAPLTGEGARGRGEGIGMEEEEPPQ